MSSTEREIDPLQAARAARLRYVMDDEPGISRQKTGKHFRYVNAAGEPIRDENEIDRINHLRIPPAWTEVWISPYPNGHIQATGRDAKGRKQYRYHERWTQRRNLVKFSRMIAFGKALPGLRKHIQKDLRLPGLPREKVLATLVELLDTTHIRIGNIEYAKSNQSYGLTTMHDKHVEVKGSTLRFHFRGKSGKEHEVDIQDQRLARIVRQCKDVPGQELFQYVDEDGGRHPITSGDVNDYLRAITGEDFTAKDFRTWGGTLLAIMAFRDCEPCESFNQAKKQVTATVKAVAEALGNTPAVCRRYYVHPLVIEAYQDGTLTDVLAHLKWLRHDNGLHPEERLVIAVLRQLENA
ncbi:MAG: DNA topoisomerase IB [Chloroflexota bacterium]